MPRVRARRASSARCCRSPGASYQGVFRNPLVDPYLLGAAAGAGLGATLVFAVWRGATYGWPVDPAAARRVRRRPRHGVRDLRRRRPRSAAAAPASRSCSPASPCRRWPTRRCRRSCCSATSTSSARCTRWILGRLSTGARGATSAWCCRTWSCASAVLLAHRRHLDVFRVGDDEASTLGAPVARVRLVVVIAATLGTAAVVSVSGLIGFVGIVVPHVVRLLAGSSYRRVLPLSLMFGAAFLILADIPGRMLPNPAETPIGVVTAFLGAPFFILVLRARPGGPAMSSLELRDVARPLRPPPGAGAVQRRRALRRVAGPDRPERRRQVVAPARRRRPRRRRPATSSSTARRCRCGRRRRGPRSSPTCRSRRRSPTT